MKAGTLGTPKRSRNTAPPSKEVWGQQEAQANQDDSARLNGVVGDNCMPFAPSECHL